MSLKLFKISQDEKSGYDTYDSAIVCAKDEESARLISPASSSHSWASYSCNVHVELIGRATKEMKEGVVLASFNAG